MSEDGPLQFDLFEGRARKTEALERMERHQWVQEARRVALAIARERGRVCADDLRDRVPPAPHDNCWGAIFNSRDFIKGGEVYAKRPVAHARTAHYWLARKQ